MKTMENLTVQFKAKLVELEQLFDAVVSHDDIKDSSVIVVSRNNSLIVRTGTSFWSCPFSPEQCSFLHNLLQNGGKMDGNAAGPWVKELSDGAIRQFIESTNKKLRSKNMPVTLSFSEWVISIKFLSAKFGGMKQNLAGKYPLQ
jgi:hypothetical protein